MRDGDATREQRREHATGDARLVQLLADDDRVGAVATLASDRFGQACAEQPCLARLQMQFTRNVTGTLPLVDVRENLAFGERAHRLSELFAFGGSPDRRGHDSSASGMST